MTYLVQCFIIVIVMNSQTNPATCYWQAIRTYVFTLVFFAIMMVFISIKTTSASPAWIMIIQSFVVWPLMHFSHHLTKIHGANVVNHPSIWINKMFTLFFWIAIWSHQDTRPWSYPVLTTYLLWSMMRTEKVPYKY